VPEIRSRNKGPAVPGTGEGKRSVTDRIRIEVADITRLGVDAVVNAANTRSIVAHDNERLSVPR